MLHILVTRFNLKNKAFSKINKKLNPLSKSWLDKRFTIFKTYCLPSVVNQTNKNFIWCICLDIDTPKEYKFIIENLTNRHAFIKLIYVDGFANLKKDFQNFVNLERRNNNYKFIITTRLDNDDILHRDFIGTIQNLYIPRHNTIIDLISGYQFILNKNKIDVRNYKLKFNPFISLIETTKEFETVISQEHNYWKKLPNKITNNSKPLWIQLIHNNDNLLNKKINVLKKAYAFDAKDFSLSNINYSQKKISAFIFNVIMYPIRVLMTLKRILSQLLVQKTL